MTDFSNPIRQVRALISDVGDAPLLPDVQIQDYLELNGWELDPAPYNVWLSAADALEAIAASEVLISKKITTQDLSTDGPAVAEALRKLAAQLRGRADAEASRSGGSFQIIDYGGSGLQEAEEWRF